jgi:hypothetical protein
LVTGAFSSRFSAFYAAIGFINSLAQEYPSVFDEFSKGRYGVGTALSSVLFIVMISFSFLIFRVLAREPAD